jgi:hypothetical protein
LAYSSNRAAGRKDWRRRSIPSNDVKEPDAALVARIAAPSGPHLKFCGNYFARLRFGLSSTRAQA